MHPTKRHPRTYSHRGYQVETLPCEPIRYNIWRPSEDQVIGNASSLREAAEVIADDITGAMERAGLRQCTIWEVLP